MVAIRWLIFGLLAGLFSIQIVAGGAARSVGGPKDVLTFVAPTKMVSMGGEQLALCHLIKQSTVLLVPLTAKSSGYVLVPDRCEASDIFYLSPGAFASAQANGTIPAAVSAEPALGPFVAHINETRLKIAALLIAIALMVKIRASFSMPTRGRPRRAGSKLALNTLDAMCHVAKLDADRDGSEVLVIAGAIRELTGASFSDDRIEALIAAANADLADTEFRRFAKGMGSTDRRTVMRGVMMVAASDGPMSDAARSFINRLSDAFDISEDETVGIFKNLLNPMEDMISSGSPAPA